MDHTVPVAKLVKIVLHCKGFFASFNSHQDVYAGWRGLVLSSALVCVLTDMVPAGDLVGKMADEEGQGVLVWERVKRDLPEAMEGAKSESWLTGGRGCSL